MFYFTDDSFFPKFLALRNTLLFCPLFISYSGKNYTTASLLHCYLMEGRIPQLEDLGIS